MRDLRDWFDREFADPNGLRPHCSLEIRFSEADDVWLSPSYGQRMCWIGVVQYKCAPFYCGLLTLIILIWSSFPKGLTGLMCRTEYCSGASSRL